MFNFRYVEKEKKVIVLCYGGHIHNAVSKIEWTFCGIDWSVTVARLRHQLMLARSDGVVREELVRRAYGEFVGYLAKWDLMADGTVLDIMADDAAQTIREITKSIACFISDADPYLSLLVDAVRLGPPAVARRLGDECRPKAPALTATLLSVVAASPDDRASAAINAVVKNGPLLRRLLAIACRC